MFAGLGLIAALTLIRRDELEQELELDLEDEPLLDAA